MIKYIAKANDDVLSFCTCSNSIAGVPGQLDCPWCGCGWMIGCMHCGKSFIYGRVVEIEGDYESLARQDSANSGFKRDEEDISGIADWMRETFEDLEVGQTVVYLDGYYLPIETSGEIEGLYARHNFKSLPHADALRTPAILEGTLGDVQYWLDRERPDRE